MNKSNGHGDLTRVEVEDDFERIVRFDSITAGQFWRVDKVPEEGKGLCDVAQILLLERVLYVDNAPHTVVMRLHPKVISNHHRKVFRMRIPAFLQHFSHVEMHTAAQDREDGQNSINQRLAAKQNDLMRLSSDPHYLDAEVAKIDAKEAELRGNKQLPAVSQPLSSDVVGAIQTGHVTALMSPGLRQGDIARIRSTMESHHSLAEKRAKVLTNKTRELAQVATELTPFFEEKAAVALASTQNIREHIDALMKGLGTLDLYVLKDVKIHTLTTGDSASPEERLTICQSVLYMDEEMAVYTPVDDDFDYRDRSLFFQKLAETPELVNQIFPTKRSVVGLAATRGYRDYARQGYSPSEVAEKTLENSTMYLLVRDGDNLHVVLSPSMWHRQTTTLFPPHDQLEAPFKGLDGSTITYENVNYADSMSEFDRVALMYRRLLILMCGLDHQKRLFGTFYDGEPSLHFVSMDFQEKHMRFIHDADGEGLLCGERPAPYGDWLRKLNDSAASGSRVLMYWPKMSIYEAVPAIFEKPASHNKYSPKMVYHEPTEINEGFIEGVLRKAGTDLVLDVPVRAVYRHTGRQSFNAKFNLSVANKQHLGTSFIVVDQLNVQEAKWYLHDRPSRELNVSGIRLLKHAIQYASKVALKEQSVRERVTAALTEAGIGQGLALDRIIDQALGSWRVAHSRQDLVAMLADSHHFNRLLNQVWLLAGMSNDPTQDIIEAETSRGNTALRIALLPGGKYVAYSNIPAASMDDRLQPYSWVQRTVYGTGKTKVLKQQESMVLLSSARGNEVIQFEHPEIAKYIPEAPLFTTPNQKAELLDPLQDGLSILRDMHTRKAEGTLFDDLLTIYKELYSRVNERSDYVQQPEYYTPLAAYAYGSELCSAGLRCELIDLVVWAITSDAERAEAESQFVRLYRDRSHARAVFASKLQATCAHLPLVAVHHVAMKTVTDGPCESLGGVTLGVIPGHSYSQGKRIENFLSTRKHHYSAHAGEEIDEALGICKPENYAPHCVVQVSKKEGRVSYVFEGTEAPSIRGMHASIKYYDTYDEAVNKASEPHQFTALGKDRSETTMVIVMAEVDPEAIDGTMPARQFQSLPERPKQESDN